jgi:phenylalanyl-tRNA synthetase beta chain
MKISVQTTKFINQHYGSAGDPAADGVDQLIEKIGAQLGAVEEVIPFGERFDKVLIVKIVSCDDHPQADRLHVCKIDDGGKAENVERDEQGLVQVVCGAPNVRAGMLAAWLPPGATVPSTYGTQDPFVLEARALRGVVSNGMLASPKELSLGDSHDGILEITLDGDEHIEPGTRFDEAYHLKDDVVIDMENKMFTHRPDCFGWLGIARELEGIQHRPYKSPDWYRIDPEFPDIEAEELPLEVINEVPELVPRFVAVALRDVQVKASPVWLQVDLARVGLRSINNIVDYTNFFMLETGQPLHAYDYDKVKALCDGDKAVLVARHAHEGEKLMLLNGKEITPRSEAIMIATDKQLIGVGGVMGGADTEVDENTKNIIIECANFDMYSIRRTSMAHGLFTDAVTRFNKGQSPLQNRAVAAKIVDEIRRFAGGKVASPLIDDVHLTDDALNSGTLHSPVHVSRQFINSRLGWDLSADEMKQLLENVEFKVDLEGDDLTVTAPFWRTDIEIPEDVVEEIGRLYGFDHLPLDTPARDLTPATRNAMFDLKAQVRAILARAGANELLTYTFVHGNLLDKVGQKRDQAFQLSNALSPDLQYYRLSILPSLLERVHPNIKAGYDEFTLFEMGKMHNLLHADDDEDGLPREFKTLALVTTASDKAAAGKQGAVYYDARKYLDYLASELGIVLEYTPLDGDPNYPVTAPYDPKRSAYVSVQGSGTPLGMVGELRPAVLRALKLPQRTAGFEIGLGELQSVIPPHRNYTQLSRFPKVDQDICLKVAADMPYSRVFSALWAGLQQPVGPDTTLFTLAPLDIYQREDDPEHRQITFRVTVASYERTLTDETVSKLLDQAAEHAKAELHAERI